MTFPAHVGMSLAYLPPNWCWKNKVKSMRYNNKIKHKNEFLIKSKQQDMPIQTKVIIICSTGLHNICAGKISCVLFNYIDYEYVFRVWLQAHRYISKQSTIIPNNPSAKPIAITSVSFPLKPDLMREII